MMVASEFLKESSIDRAGALLLPLEDRLGWLLYASTTSYTKMDLSKPLPPTPSAHLTRQLNPRRSTSLAPCPSALNQPQYRLSISSENSDPGMVEDPPCWSGSETTVEEHHASETELWDSYFWSQEKDTLLSPFHQVDPRPNATFRNQDANLSAYNRNFASSNLSGLNISECSAELHRSDAIRTPRHTPKSLPHNTYSPFPAVSPLPTQTYESPHKCWPLHCDSQTQSQRTVLRSRAHTTPANCKPLAPSNLSTCSTLDDRYSPSHSSTSSASGLYMRSAPVSPDFAPLMDLMEKSYFDDDSDDEESTLVALATRLHIRSSSANSSTPCGNKEKTLRSKKSRRNLKCAGDTFKGMFGRKKSAGSV